MPDNVYVASLVKQTQIWNVTDRFESNGINGMKDKYQMEHIFLLVTEYVERNKYLGMR